MMILLQLLLAQLLCYVTSELTCEDDSSGPCQWSCNLQGWSRGQCSDQQQCQCDGANINADKLFNDKNVDSKDNLKVKPYSLIHL